MRPRKVVVAYHVDAVATKTKAGFIQPMLLQRAERVPEGPDWLYELKLDGYRALAIKTGGKLHFRSRNDNASARAIQRL